MDKLISAATATTSILGHLDAARNGRPDWNVWRAALDAAAQTVMDEAVSATTETAPLACEDENGFRSMDAVQFFEWQAGMSRDAVRKMNEALCRLCAGQFGDISSVETLRAAVRTHLTVNALACRMHNVLDQGRR